MLTEVLGAAAKRLDDVASALAGQLAQHARQLSDNMVASFDEGLSVDVLEARRSLMATVSEFSGVLEVHHQRIVAAASEVMAVQQQLDHDVAELERAHADEWRAAMPSMATFDRPLPKLVLSTEQM
jgi:hypothetical protein